MCLGLYVNKELIGNLMVYLAKNTKVMYHTKLLKLIYLIDERSTIVTGSPITWLEYKVWNFGPVAEDIYFSKNKGYNKFSQYVKFCEKNNGYIIKPIVEFDNSMFTEQDLSIIDYVLGQYGNMSSDKLVKVTHEENSLWSKEKKKNNIKFSSENNTSEYVINFVDLINNDPFKKTIYYSTLENIELAATLS